MIRLLRICVLAALALLAVPGYAEDVVRIAVAANFKSTLQDLTAAYAQKHPTKFVIASGASGALYTQIRAEAPFDLFFSADTARAEQLDRDQATVPGTRVTYAIGRLVIWTPRKPVSGGLKQTLSAADIRTIAIANPATAPYGAAAEEVLKRLNLGARVKIVRGENVGQTFQFAATGNADAAFIALAQARDYERANKRSLVTQILTVDASLYTPIEQQAVLLAKAKDNAAARDFLQFVQTEEAQRLITSAGYRSLTWLPPGCHGCERPKSTADKPAR